MPPLGRLVKRGQAATPTTTTTTTTPKLAHASSHTKNLIIRRPSISVALLDGKKSAPLVDPPLVCPYSRPSISGTPCDMKGVSIAVVPCDMEGPIIAVVVVTKWVRCPRVGPGVRARLRTRPVYNRGGREWRELPREDHFRTGSGPVLDSTYVPGGVRGAGASPGELVKDRLRTRPVYNRGVGSGGSFPERTG